MEAKNKANLLRNMTNKRNKQTNLEGEEDGGEIIDDQVDRIEIDCDQVECEESNIVINLDEDDEEEEEDFEGGGSGQVFGQKNHDDNFDKWQASSDTNKDINHQQQQSASLASSTSNNAFESSSANQHRPSAVPFEADQLVWFDPNLFGYSIPGKIVDFHPELNLLTVEAYSQPPILNDDSQLSQNSQEHCDWIDEYRRNWLDADLEGELQLYQLSEPSQLACLKKRAPLVDPSGCADLVQLPELLPESIVWNLKIRSSQGLVYTNCGAKILISVNPNEHVPELYNLDQVNRHDANLSSKLCQIAAPTWNETGAPQFSSLFRWLLLSDAEPSVQDDNNAIIINPSYPTDEPHIFAMAMNSVKQLLITSQDQCFVLLGENGSGKSEACKLLVQYVAAINKAPSNRLTEQILETQQVLESFGNAARRRNHNSSRFAKLITLNLSLESGLLISAQTNDLKLLDRSRIVGQQGAERNYHIFYELLAGLKQQERERYGLQTAEKYFYLNQGDQLELAQKDDAEDFRCLLNSMQVLGFTHEEQDSCFRILASILHLGNIYFHRRLLAIRTGKLATEPAGPGHSSSVGAQVEGVEIGSDTEVRWVSHLLQIQFESVMQCLSMRTTWNESSHQQAAKSKERIVTPLNIDQALDARDALARALYTCLFRWLLERLNAATSSSSEIINEQESLKSISESLCEFQPDKLTTNNGNNSNKQRSKAKQRPAHQVPKAAIAILDCFGFENLSENNFEQLCINLSAELLQSHARRYLIKLELIEYERERLNWTPDPEFVAHFSQHSSSVVNLLARKPLGILPLLDDECNFPKGTDISFMEKCHHNHAVNKNYIRSQRDLEEDPQDGVGASNCGILCEFGIRHFGNKSRIVFYQSDGFIEKNRDSLRSDLVELVQSSSSPLIKSMMTKFLQHQSASPQPQTSQSSMSSSAVPNDTRTLTRTHDGRYVCMKPRQTTVSARFQDALISNRVVESLNLSGSSSPRSQQAPANIWFIVCLRPNRIQASAKLFDVSFVQEQIGCLNLLELTYMRQAGFPVRLRYQDFLRRYQCLIEKCQVSLAEASRHKRTLRDLSLDIIDLSKAQANCKHRYRFGQTKVFLNESLFHHLEARRLARYHHAIRVMQKNLRMWLDRRKFLLQRRAACLIQANLRAFQQRELYKRQRHSIIFIQRKWRQILLARRHQRLEAKRKAKRAQQLKQLQDLQTQHVRKQASQLRFRQQQQSQQALLDIPEDLASLYRAQRDWLQPAASKAGPIHQAIDERRSMELENYGEWSLGELEDQEQKRLALLELKNLRRNNNYKNNSRKGQSYEDTYGRFPAPGSLLGVPFLALIEPDVNSSWQQKVSNSGTNVNSDHHEILAHTIDQFKRDFATRLKSDLQLANHLSQLESSLNNDAINWDERYSLDQFVEQFYPIEAPQFGYSRLPITKPFSWHSLRRLHSDWLRNAPSKSAAQQISARFELLKSEPVAMYKLILRYIDSNHDYGNNNIEDNNNNNYYTPSSNASVCQGDHKTDLKQMIKFKLMSDYLTVMCLREPLLRQEYYLQLASLSWQNPKQSSQNNLWKLMLNSLCCFGPDNADLTCFLLQYVNDYCLNKKFRSLLMGRLAIWLVTKAPGASSASGCCPNDENLHSALCSTLACQRSNPVTMVEYLANHRLIKRIMLPVSAFMDEHSHQSDEDELDGFEASKLGYQSGLGHQVRHQISRAYNYSMRTLVEVRPTDNAELIARRALQARNVPPSNLVGWSLEIQHQASALSDLSCRLRGDESPLDHLARIEMLPELLGKVEEPLAWTLGESSNCVAESRFSAAFSASRGSHQIRNSSRLSSQSTQSNQTHNPLLDCPSYRSRFSCCSTGSCQLAPSSTPTCCNLSVASSAHRRKRRNSSSGVWSLSTMNTSQRNQAKQNYSLDDTDISFAGHTSEETRLNYRHAPPPDYDLEYDKQEPSFANRLSGAPFNYFRRHRRSMSVQDLSLQHLAGHDAARYNNYAAPGHFNYDGQVDNLQFQPGVPVNHIGHRRHHQQQNYRRLSASSLQQIHNQSSMFQYKQNIGSANYEAKQQADAISTDWDLDNAGPQQTKPSQASTKKSLIAKGKLHLLMPKKKVTKSQQQNDAVSSSAMSDTSEAPSLASHVRDIKAPLNQGSQADVDRYLDDLFRPMLNEADLDELTDARSLATSIKGTRDEEQVNEVNDRRGEDSRRESRVLSPTFESLLRGLTDATNISQNLDSPSARRSTTPSLETDLKSMNFAELKALNERLESEIKAARSSNSNRMSDLMTPTCPASSIPEPPPQPEFATNEGDYAAGSAGSAGLSDDLYSRAKTIRIGKWRWPPALSDLANNEPQPSAATETETKPVQDQLQQQNQDNVGRIKISLEMKAKLEQLTISSNGAKSNQGADPEQADSASELEPEIKIVKPQLDSSTSSVQQLALQRKRLLERQLIGGARATAQGSSSSSSCTTSDRLSQELGSTFGSSGKVLAAKQQLAAAAGLDLASLASSAGSSRRASVQVVPAHPPTPSGPKLVCTDSGELSHNFVSMHEPAGEQLADDELGPKTRAAVNQRHAFYGENAPENTQKSSELSSEMATNKQTDRESSSTKQKLKISSQREKFSLNSHASGPPASNNWVSSSPDHRKQAVARPKMSLPDKSKLNQVTKLRNLPARNKLTNVADYKLDNNNNNNNNNNKELSDESDICLSYANINWRARIRKEFFLPSESYDEPLVLQLLFTQLVADVFNPRQWTRLNSKERALIKALMKDHAIGYSDRLPQIGELEPVKLELIRMARSFGLYFTRSYPAQNLACLANDLLINNATDADHLFADWEALSIMRHLLIENRLGLVWIDMIALHHTGVRLVSVVGGPLESTQLKAASMAATADELLLNASSQQQQQQQQPVGYKVIELLKYRDMRNIVALSSSELLLSMANGRRSWILSMEQPGEVASMLNWLLADYRESRESKKFNAAGGQDQASALRDGRQPCCSPQGCVQTGDAGSICDGCCNGNGNNSENMKLNNNITAKKLNKQAHPDKKKSAEFERATGEDALLAAHLGPDVNCRDQRQIGSRKPASDSLPFANNACPSPASNVSHHTRAKNHNLQTTAAPNKHQPGQHPRHRASAPSSASVSDLGAADCCNCNGITEGSLSLSLTANNNQSATGGGHSIACSPKSEIRSSQSHQSLSSASTSNNKRSKLADSKNQQQHKRNSNLSAWHSSLSRMSSKMSLFSGSTGSARKDARGNTPLSPGSRYQADHQPDLASQDQANSDDGSAAINYASKTNTLNMSVAESMKIGLDTWIECKADLAGEDASSRSKSDCRDLAPSDHDYDPNDATRTTTTTNEMNDRASSNGDSASSEPIHGLQAKGPDSQYSLMQFALHHFREALDKYGEVNGDGTLGKATLSSSDGHRTLRGSLKLFETLRRTGNKAKQHAEQVHSPETGKEWTWRELAQMVKHSCSPIKRSLLKLPSEELDRRAVDCFAAILQYTGDIGPGQPSSHPVRLLEGGEIECVYLILMNCHNFVLLRDEIYAQLMKQTTNNRSPHSDSCLRAWRLFSIVAAFFQCSDSMRPYLMKYLETAAFDKRRAYCSVALICLQNLRKTFRFRGRKNVPSIEEIAATSAGRNSKRQIYRLPGGTERVINTRSSTVVEDIIQEICSTMLNISDPNEMLEFSLYCIADGCDPYTMPLNRADYILDVTTELIKKHQQYFLIFCRSVWFYPLRLDSRLYIELIFNQIAPDYLEGLLLILPGDYSSRRQQGQAAAAAECAQPALKLKRKLVKQISRLAALLHRASGTDSLPQEDELQYLLPKPIKLQQEQESLNSNSNSLAEGALTSADFTETPLSSDRWLELVQQDWTQMTTLDALDAKAQFLQIIRHWPLFGSSFFACNLIQRDLLKPLEFILALNKFGIQMLDMESHQVVHKYSFNEIISTRKVRSEDGALFLDLKCGNLMKRTIIRIQTDQAHEISRLIRQYIDIEFIHSQPQANHQSKTPSPSPSPFNQMTTSATGSAIENGQ